MLRIVARLANAEFLNEEPKNPIALPRKHALTRLFIRSAHRDVGYLGVSSTRAELGRRFFIPKFISTVKHEIHACKTCRKQRPIAVQAPVALIHNNRLQFQAFPFASCGMDYFGPFVISRKRKRWGLIFMSHHESDPSGGLYPNEYRIVVFSLRAFYSKAW
ncbi:hypothetical protein M513_11401 [Trichuris suis]|uniref:Integrase zinc-binding domain-containing protein n=1 Tax=Trichuris suis TaxID=68888 RepID=A0A085LRX7_9BILA|nr:hypothetical protein M513_11401 [Trichuris suis]